MKKIRTYLKITTLALLTILVFTATACNKEEKIPTLPKIITSAAYDITENSFSMDASFIAAGMNNSIEVGSEVISDKGVCWGTEPNPNIDGDKISTGSGVYAFYLTINGLKSGTTYYFRTYTISSSGIEYGDQRNVTTLGQLAYTLPYVERFARSQFLPPFWNMIDHDGDEENWYAYTSRFRGAISDSYSGGTITPYNFLVTPKIALQGSGINLSWNVGATHLRDYEEHYKVIVSEQPFTAENCTTVGTIVFEETLTAETGRTLVLRSVSLSSYSGKDIYVAWVHYNCTDQDGLVVTDIRIGSSENPAPTTSPVLGIIAVDDITPLSLDVSVSIPDDGGLTVIRRGFCYSKVSPATIDDTVVEVAVTSATAAAFSAVLDAERGESYFIRAFAVNAEGMSYSSEISVTTPPYVKTVLFSEDFASGITDFG